MPNTMSFDRKAPMENVKISDDVFALHALAIIAVHDSQGDEQEMTLSHIAMADDYIRFARGTLLFGYLVTFGRQAISLLERTLVVKFGWTELAIEQKVAEIEGPLKAAAEKAFKEKSEKVLKVSSEKAAP